MQTLHKNTRTAEWLQQNALFSRRHFLKSSALAIGAVGGSSLLTGCNSNDTVTGLKSLTLLEKNLYEKLIEVCLPTTGTTLTSPQSLPVIENLDQLYSSIDANIRADLKAAASLFEYGSTLIGFHFKPFSQLNDEDGKNYIEKWQRGATFQRAIAGTLKKLLYTSYWREEKTWAPLSYDGPVSVKWGLEPQGNSPLPE